MLLVAGNLPSSNSTDIIDDLSSSVEKSSKVSGFYKMPVEKRVEFVKNFSDLSEEETKIFSSSLD
ncbi:MAG: hypothetical protein ACPHDM_02045, partial [Candidatus Poseidoniaceae archaeon]